MPSNFTHLFYKSFTLLIIGYLSLSGAMAQSGMAVNGTVVDAATKKPIEFATVALQDLTGKTIGGVAGDLEGKFQLPNVPAGRYNLVISFIGYQNKIQPIAVAGASKILNIGTIALETSAQTLKEVTVTSIKPLIEQTDDGLIYNAENDIAAIGGTAADVLKNVPMLAVDLDGNVSLQGTNKIKVLINNKPSTILATDVAEALRQIPSDMIKRVEVITSPSAKYESEGTGGIINIVTKKNTLQGVNGNVNASAGNRTKNSNANVNIRKKNIGVRASTGINLSNNYGSSESDQTFFETRQVEQTSRYDRQGKSTYAQIGADYDFNEKTELSTSLRLNKGDNENQRFQNTTEIFTDGRASIRNREVASVDDFNSMDASIDFRKEFKEDQELSVEGSYSRNSRFNNYDLEQKNGDEMINYLEQNQNTSGNEELQFEVDYEHQISKKSEIEAGLRTSLRSNNSNYLFSKADVNSEFRFEEDSLRSNIYQNQQNVFSSYLSYTYSFTKDIRLELGGRYEYTAVHANFVSSETSVNRPYQNILPNVSFRVRIKENQRFRVSYSPRIQRPDINLLNPYRDTRNQYSVRFGNPDLDPERTHQVSAEYSTYFDKTYLNFSSFYRTIGNDIGQYQYQSDSTIYITYLNIGKKNTFGSSFSASTRFKDRGQIGGNVNVYYTKINSAKTSNAGVMYNANINASYKFGNFVSAQLNGSFNSPNIELQGRSSSFQTYSIGLRREFWDKKAGISINAENFLASGNRVRSTFETEQFRTSSVNNFNNRIFRVSLNYRFGKIKFKSEGN